MRRLRVTSATGGGAPGSGGRRCRAGSARLALLAAVVLLAAAPVRAQTNLETNSGIQFNFSAPGAANLALGGAFVGLAFDGTAAYTNPAGLTNLLAPELWFEARSWSYTHVYTDRGRIPGVEITGRGEDDVPGLVAGEATDGVVGPSFFSYVHPGRDWSVALYGHKLLDFEASFSTRGAFLERIRRTDPQGFGVLGERAGRLPALRNRMRTTIDSVGVSGAYRLTPALSLGAGLSYSDFRIDSLAERFVHPDLFAPADLDDPEAVANIQRQWGGDADWSVVAGVLWQSRNRVWSAGAVYRQGPDFGFRTLSRDGPGSPLTFEPVEGSAVFHVPDVYGLGVAWRPSDRLTVALDWDRVEHSDLLDDFTDVFGLAALFPEGDPELDRFRIEDADELHLGVELWFPRPGSALLVRLGGWYDPDHGLHFDGENPGLQAVFRGASDQVHATAGVGIATRIYQVDVAVDWSERLTIVSLSVGRRF